MGRQIKGLLYFFIADLRYSLFIFWTILISILAVTLVIAYFLIDVDDGFMTLSLTGPLYVYCAILGFITVKEAVPFAIKLGATRKNLFISLGIFFFGLSLMMAIVTSSIQVIVDMFTEKIGMDTTFLFLHVAYFINDTWLTRIGIDTSIMFFFFSLLFVIGLLFYKYGLAGGGAVVGLIIIIGITGFAQGWLSDFFIHIFKSIDLMLFGQLLVLGCIIYILSILMLRTITIVKTK
jgi:hypothetical protein